MVAVSQSFRELIKVSLKLENTVLLVARWEFPLFRHRNVDHVALRCGSSLSWRRGRSLWSRRFRKQLRFHCFLYIDKVVDVLVVQVVLVPQGMEKIEKPRFADHGKSL